MAARRSAIGAGVRLGAIGFVLALALSGCSAFFPSDVTPTVPAASPEPVACSTSAAQLTWQPMQKAQPAPIGHREITVAADGTETKVDTEVAYSSSLVSDDLMARAYFAPEWIDFLLSEFERTGQTQATGLGHPHPDFDSAKPSVPLVGTTIMGFQTDQIKVAFDLTCSGTEVGSGLLTMSGNSLMGTMLVCGQTGAEDQTSTPPATGDPNPGGFVPDEGYQKQLRSYCPANG